MFVPNQEITHMCYIFSNRSQNSKEGSKIRYNIVVLLIISMTPPNAQNNNKTDNVGDTAPHQIVNWVSMQDTVNSNLAKCKTCKTKGIKLVDQKQISLASTFELECETCHNQAEKVRQHV